MVAARPLRLPLIFIVGLLSTKSGIDGFGVPCPMSAVINLTEETPDIWGSINKSGNIFAPEVVWIENNERFGCLCDFKLCIPLCCPEEYAMYGDDCIKDNSTFRFTDLDYEKSAKDRDVFTIDDDFCARGDRSVEDHEFKLLPNGSIYVKARSTTVDLNRYCIQREFNSQNYSAIACTGPKWYERLIAYDACLGVSMLFTLTTFIVYSVIPELKNLYGSIFRCFLASNIAGTFTILLSHILIPFSDFGSPTIRIFHVTAVDLYNYFASARMVWLNIMSFDIWRTFRKFRPRPDVDVKKHQEVRFIGYSIYAWGVAAAYRAIPKTCCEVGYFDCSDFQWGSIMWYVYTVPFLLIGICNTCLYILTALTIRQRKREAAHLVDGVNKHQSENEEWFNLYLKLFVIMGGFIILEAVTHLSNCKMCNYLLFVLEALQSVFVFLMFVWKNDVKQALCKRFYGIHRTLDVLYRRDRTVGIES